MTRRILFPAAVLAALFLLALSAPEARAQSGDNATVDVEISLTSPPPTCSFASQSNLDYGTAEKPTSGSGSVTISATSGARSASGTSVSGSHSVGQVRLSGSNVSSYVVSRSFPSSLTRSGGSLPFSGAWAQSASSGSGYQTIGGASYSGSGGGAGSSFSRYFRFGGTASGISIGDPNGLYDATITVSASCN